MTDSTHTPTDTPEPFTRTAREYTFPEKRAQNTYLLEYGTLAPDRTGAELYRIDIRVDHYHPHQGHAHLDVWTATGWAELARIPYPECERGHEPDLAGELYDTARNLMGEYPF
jgi:hypothetical protein